MRINSLWIIVLIMTCNSYMLRPRGDAIRTKVIESIRQEVKDKNARHHHKAYDNLAYYVDTYGPRLWGSESMAEAVQDLYNQIKDYGFDKVQLENLGQFQSWKRGEESLILKSPRETPTKLNIIGLGLSPSGDANGEVIMIHSFEELEEKKDQVNGKIVCYNFEWTSYGAQAKFRSSGPKKAQDVGAIGVLIRSLASFSIDSPHTGATSYEGLTIPAAALSVEDADMFERMYQRGQTIEVELHLENSWYDTTSDNILAEITGSKYPNEVILMGGHWDSWDTGSQTGANDDGGGVMTCLEALKILKDLGIKAKRTIRFIAWSGEEMGLPGNGAEYYATHHDNEKHILVFESDLGSTKPYGFGVTAPVRATQRIVYLAQQYLTGIGAERIIPNDGSSVDASYLNRHKGTPMMKNEIVDNASHDFYFIYHHSAADSMLMMDADDMDDNVIAIASMMYLIADMDEELPTN